MFGAIPTKGSQSSKQSRGGPQQAPLERSASGTSLLSASAGDIDRSVLEQKMREQAAMAAYAPPAPESYGGTYASAQGEARSIEQDTWYEALGPGRTVVADAGLKAQDFAPRFPTPDRLQEQLQLGMGPGSMTLLEMELDPDGSELASDAIDRGGIDGESIVIGTFGVS